MLSLTTNSFLGFTRKEFWFYNDESIVYGSYNVFSAAKTIANAECNFIEKYNTVIIDLTKSELELYNAIHKTYRYDIKAAEKFDLRQLVISQVTPLICKELVCDYNAFANEKKIKKWDFKKLMNLSQQNSLYVTHAIINDIRICTHIYIYDDSHISLWASFHNGKQQDARLRGEANKWLHWKDILAFKRLNYLEYDMGGLNMQKLPGVSKFKLNFGGEVIENYRYIQAKKFIFWMIKLTKTFLNRK